MAKYPGSNKNVRPRRSKSSRGAKPQSSTRNRILNTKLNNRHNQTKSYSMQKDRFKRPTGVSKKRKPPIYAKPDNGGQPPTDPCPPGYYQCPDNYCGPNNLVQECVIDVTTCYFCPPPGEGETGSDFLDMPIGDGSCPFFTCWDGSCARTLNECPPNPNFNAGEGELVPDYGDYTGTGDWSGNTGSGTITINYNLHHGQNLLSFPFNMTTAQSSLNNIISALTSHNMPSDALITGITTEGEAASYNAVSGTWVGNLTSINPLKSYWVNINNPNGSIINITLNGQPLISSGSPTYYLNNIVPTYVSYPGIRQANFCNALQNFSDGSIQSIVGEGKAATWNNTVDGPCGNGWVGNLTNIGFSPGEGFIFTSEGIPNFQFNI